MAIKIVWLIYARMGADYKMVVDVAYDETEATEKRQAYAAEFDAGWTVTSCRVNAALVQSTLRQFK